MAKALFFLIADEGKYDELQAAITDGVEQHLGGQSNVTVQLMRKPEMDFFYNDKAPYARPHLVLEVITAPGKPLSSLHDAFKRVLAGTHVTGAPESVYYHYLMVKREGFSTADYIDYYSNFHCRMGLNTPGLGAYSQNYIDQEGSQALAELLGVASKEVTSISEMKIPDVMAFLSSLELIELSGLGDSSMY